MLIDLQLHSTYSDGYLTPTEAAQLAARHGVKAASLTDHNTVGGWDEFKRACLKLRIKPIVGLELYVCVSGRRCNLLWYNFDACDPELHDLLRESQTRRRGQIRRGLEKLASHGFKLNINKILDEHNHYVPINRAVDAVMASSENVRRIQRELGIKSPREEDVITAYFKNKRGLNLRECYVSIQRVLKLKKRLGGQIIWCHPAKYGSPRRKLFDKLLQNGLDGIEVMSPHHNLSSIMGLQQWVREHKLISTGGSDFHIFEGKSAKIQHAWQYYYIDSRLLPGVERVIG